MVLNLNCVSGKLFVSKVEYSIVLVSLYRVHLLELAVVRPLGLNAPLDAEDLLLASVVLVLHFLSLSDGSVFFIVQLGLSDIDSVFVAIVSIQGVPALVLFLADVAVEVGLLPHLSYLLYLNYTNHILTLLHGVLPVACQVLSLILVWEVGLFGI